MPRQSDDRKANGAERRKNRNLKPLARLLPYLARNRGKVIGALSFLVLAAITTLSLPVAVRRVIDVGFADRSTSFIDNYFSVLLVLAGVLAIASAGRYYFVVSLGERIVADLRKDVFDRLTWLSPAFYDRSLSGEIVSRLTADTTQVKAAVGSTASLALRNLILFVGAITMMAVTSPGLSLIVIAAIPLIVLPLIAFGRSVRRRSRAAQDMLAEATAFASEAIGTMRTVQANTSERATSQRYAGAVDRAFEAARLSIRARAALTAFAIFLIFSSIVAVLWIGSERVATDTMSGGTLGQFLLYAVFAAGALGQLSEVWGDLLLAAGAAERLTELLAEEPEIATIGALSATGHADSAAYARGDLRFDAVSFAYAGAETRALDELSFSVGSGETIAVVGTSGAGKSTLFALIERFYDPGEGTITLDGNDIRGLEPETLRSQLALVPQEVTIFAASAADNIAFGRPDATREEIEEAARVALADGFIRALPQGYDTVVGERGITLSGGERQRMAIARAVLRDAPVLLLDEATSALDSQSETLVQSALDRLKRDRTTLVIAHRLATVLAADRILVLEAGRIVEEGTHRELVAKNGSYARLARLQFQTDQHALAAE